MPDTLETLNGALNAYLYASLNEAADEARRESRLFDACLAAGMSFDEPDASGWATARILDWLQAA